MSTKESTTRTLMVALAVSLVSSVFVAGAAVSLKPVQIENRQLDKQRSILSIAGLGGDGMSAREVKDLFASRIQARVVDLETVQLPGLLVEAVAVALQGGQGLVGAHQDLVG